MRHMFDRARHSPVRSVTALLRKASAVTVLGTALLTADASPVAAAPLPAGCVHEQRTSTGAVNPNGLCVSLGYGIRPAAAPASAPAIHNVIGYAQNGEALPADYYVRSDVAQQIAAGTARARATYLLFYGGGFFCGSRADVSSQAREIASRGYVVVAAEYPLVGSMPAYGNFRPNPGHNQGQITTKGANSCSAFQSQIVTSSAWLQGFLPRVRTVGLEPVLTEAQRHGQSLVRTLRRYGKSYGVNPKRIFAMGWSAGGSVALRLALGGDDDVYLNGNVDPGDSTIAGAVSIGGPACFPGSTAITTPMFQGQIRPSEVPACRFQASARDPLVLMVQEPRGGLDDPTTPSRLLLDGCTAINARVRGRCIYEDRAPADGGYIADGQHAFLTWPDFRRLLDALAKQGVGAP